uniref:(northern house mosquito) hypothetical protein n=1 Tax=Culex pipiens TaxID=7175 RepID=A0A8D8B2D4_CULPI
MAQNKLEDSCTGGGRESGEHSGGIHSPIIMENPSPGDPGPVPGNSGGGGHSSSTNKLADEFARSISHLCVLDSHAPAVTWRSTSTERNPRNNHPTATDHERNHFDLVH